MTSHLGFVISFHSIQKSQAMVCSISSLHCNSILIVLSNFRIVLASILIDLGMIMIVLASILTVLVIFDLDGYNSDE